MRRLSLTETFPKARDIVESPLILVLDFFRYRWENKVILEEECDYSTKDHQATRSTHTIRISIATELDQTYWGQAQSQYQVVLILVLRTRFTAHAKEGRLLVEATQKTYGCSSVLLD
ncbi:hypothetical protein OWV82_015465 [Melia azedarach]|uniref:Uncharacterized protein n=1 Tax=Melia azedarach TaxID=155640 RepID=A0ACC1XQ70_MELAZ|nr:hypothetical protein OWV82_015465 [Melia azedarach]